MNNKKKINLLIQIFQIILLLMIRSFIKKIQYKQKKIHKIYNKQQKIVVSVIFLYALQSQHFLVDIICVFNAFKIIKRYVEFVTVLSKLINKYNKENHFQVVIKKIVNYIFKQNKNKWVIICSMNNQNKINRKMIIKLYFDNFINNFIENYLQQFINIIIIKIKPHIFIYQLLLCYIYQFQISIFLSSQLFSSSYILLACQLSLFILFIFYLIIQLVSLILFLFKISSFPLFQLLKLFILLLQLLVLLLPDILKLQFAYSLQLLLFYKNSKFQLLNILPRLLALLVKSILSSLSIPVSFIIFPFIISILCNLSKSPGNSLGFFISKVKLGLNKGNTCQEFAQYLVLLYLSKFENKSSLLLKLLIDYPFLLLFQPFSKLLLLLFQSLMLLILSFYYYQFTSLLFSSQFQSLLLVLL